MVEYSCTLSDFHGSPAGTYSGERAGSPNQGERVSTGDAIAEALWYVGPGRAEIRRERLNPLAEGMVRVRALYGAVSRGTESLIASRKGSRRANISGCALPSWAEGSRSRSNMVTRRSGGSRPDRTRLIGRNVFALHPHQTVFDVPADAVVPVPADVPIPRAVLAANMETALNATWDAEPVPSGPIAVVGAGVVGALVGVPVRARPGRGRDADRHQSGA